MRITAQELETRRQRIVDTAYELFCEHGIDEVSMLQIARQASVSLNSVFRYFHSKAILLQETQKILWEKIVSNILSNSKEQLRLARTGLEEVAILLANFKKLYEEHSNYLVFACDYKLFLLRHHIKLTEFFYQEMFRPITDTFCLALEKGRADGSICTEETVESQFYTVWGVMRGFVEEIVIYDRMYEGRNPWKDQFDRILRSMIAILKVNENEKRKDDEKH